MTTLPLPRDAILSRLRPIGAAVLLLAVLCVLEAEGMTSLQGWSEFAAPRPYAILFAAYVATWVLAREARGSTRRLILLVGSIATAGLYHWQFAAASLVWVVAFHRVLFAGGRARPLYGFGFAIATFIGLGIACNRDLWPELLGEHPELGHIGYLFAIAYTLRIAALLHEVRLRRSVLPLADVVLYFVFAPFFVIVPYMLAIPRCGRFRLGLAEHDLAIERSGIRLIAWGVVLTLAVVALHQVYDPRAAFDASLRAHDVIGIALHSIPAYPVDAVLEVCAIASVLVGMVRVLGIDLGPSFQAPLLAQSVSEFWRRWNTHFRDLLVDLFYVPVVMRLRRTPERAIVVGCISVFVVGSTLFHLPKHYFRYGSVYPSDLHVFVENIVMCAIVSVALLREAREARARIVRTRPTPVRAALRMVRTWAVIVAVVFYAGYGSQLAVFGERPSTAIQPRSR